MDIEFNFSKIKYKGKRRYKLTIFLNKNLYTSMFNNNYIFNLIKARGNSKFNAQPIIQFVMDKNKILFLNKYSKIETIQLLSRYSKLNEYKLYFKLKQFGLIDDNELIFESNNLNQIKNYLQLRFNAIDILMKLEL